jgi:hypothetical protein
MNIIYPPKGTVSTTYLPNKTLSIPRYMDYITIQNPIVKEGGMTHRLAELEVEVEFG